jgi:8-oxo-dGTP diphosphatase
MHENQPYFPSDKPAVTVDVLIFTVAEGELKIALIRRGIEPFKGAWAIPGGFVLADESLEEAALREVREEAGVTDVYLEQLYTFGDPKRDPRGRVITVAYFALVPAERVSLEAASDAADVRWFPADRQPGLAFDHAVIVKRGVERLRGKLEYTNIAFGLLPDRFRLSEMQSVYEAILNRRLDKRNFRKWVSSVGLVEPTDSMDSTGAHRPARLYRFMDRENGAFR